MIRLSLTYAAVLLSALGLAWLVLSPGEGAGGSGSTPSAPSPEPITTVAVLSQGLRGAVPTAATVGDDGAGVPVPDGDLPTATQEPSPVLLDRPEVTPPAQRDRGTTRALTEDEVYALAVEVSGDEAWAARMAGVAMCESRGQTWALGALGERGMFQVRAEYHGAVPADARGQVAQAFAIWQAHGFSPWSCA